MRALPLDRLERVQAWGLASGGMNYVYRPSGADEIRAAFDRARAAGTTVGLRGAGRSYGDAACNAEQVLLDLSGMNRILEWDAATGVVRVEPGATIEQLWRHVLPDGWWPPVVPGTMYPTLGGCVATNIHGKNNWQAGPIGEHVLAFTALLTNGEVVRCTPDGDPELFHAFISGLGLLGCFTSITLQMKRVYSGRLRVTAETAPNIEAMLERMEALKDAGDYLVGWTDCIAGGRSLGRGQIHSADYLAPGDDPSPTTSLQPANQDLPDRLFGVIPKGVMWRLMKPFVNAPSMRLVNAAKYASDRLSHGHTFEQSLAEFSFLLDYIPGLRQAYLPGGLIQYQCFIPKEEAPRTFRRAIEMLRGAGLPSLLGVVKRHRPDRFLLTHSVDGFSLAMDFKVTEGNRRRLSALLHQVDEVVLEAGGRFYFAKDSTLRPQVARAFLGEEALGRFRALKARCDPEGLLETNLSRRVFPELTRRPVRLQPQVTGEPQAA